ncbi:MAG: hypothetical protein ACRCS6_09725 [Turicibacter sp.]
MHELIKPYVPEDYNDVVTFLKQVTTLDHVNVDIIAQSILIRREQKLIGMVSYEPFGEVGIIRYFIYDKTVTPELIVNLFFELYKKANQKGVNQLIAVATHQYACHLFEMLGFVETKQPLQLEISELMDRDNVHILSIKL